MVATNKLLAFLPFLLVATAAPMGTTLKSVRAVAGTESTAADEDYSILYRNAGDEGFSQKYKKRAEDGGEDTSILYKRAEDGSEDTSIIYKRAEDGDEDTSILY